jgi:hypothetical protein
VLRPVGLACVRRLVGGAWARICRPVLLHTVVPQRMRSNPESKNSRTVVVVGRGQHPLVACFATANAHRLWLRRVRWMHLVTEKCPHDHDDDGNHLVTSSCSQHGFRAKLGSRSVKDKTAPACLTTVRGRCTPSKRCGLATVSSRHRMVLLWRDTPGQCGRLSSIRAGAG